VTEPERAEEKPTTLLKGRAEVSDPEKSTGIGWERPSPSRHGYDWDTIAAQLKARPGEWMKIFEEGPTSVANGIRQGHVKQLMRADGFETTTRNNKKATETSPKTCDLFIRYVKKGT
jgi:hypothetical protein